MISVSFTTVSTGHCARSAAARYAPRLRRDVARAARRFFRGKDVSACFALADDKKTKELNLKYLGRRGATDVIAFYYDERSRRRAPEIEGDVVINVEQAERQRVGRLYGELFLLAVHGLLHLAGYEDYTAAGRSAMERLQDKIVRSAAPPRRKS